MSFKNGGQQRSGVENCRNQCQKSPIVAVLTGEEIHLRFSLAIISAAIGV